MSPTLIPSFAANSCCFENFFFSVFPPTVRMPPSFIPFSAANSCCFKKTCYLECCATVLLYICFPVGYSSAAKSIASKRRFFGRFPQLFFSPCVSQFHTIFCGKWPLLQKRFFWVLPCCHNCSLHVSPSLLLDSNAAWILDISHPFTLALCVESCSFRCSNTWHFDFKDISKSDIDIVSSFYRVFLYSFFSTFVCESFVL